VSAASVVDCIHRGGSAAPDAGIYVQQRAAMLPHVARHQVFATFRLCWWSNAHTVVTVMRHILMLRRLVEVSCNLVTPSVVEQRCHLKRHAIACILMCCCLLLLLQCLRWRFSLTPSGAPACGAWR
jgi:hypothetical protein